MINEIAEFIKVSDFIEKGLIVVDYNGKIIFANKWITKLSGNKLEGSFILKTLPKLAKIDVMKKIKNSIESGKMWFFSYTIHREVLTFEMNGERYHSDLYVFPWKNNYSILLFDNITVYVEKIEKIHKLKSELKEKNISARRANKEITLLKNIASIMVFGDADDRTVANHILKLLLNFFSGNGGGIYIYDLETKSFKLVAHKGISKKIQCKYSTVLFDNEKFATFIALKKKKSIIIEDVKAHAKRYPVLSELKSNSLIIIPVVSTKGNNIYGVVYIGFYKKRMFDSRERAFLRVILKYLTLGYERRFLFRTLKEKNEELNRILQEKIKEINEQYKMISKAEKLSILGRVSASIIHDIGTPLTYIRSNAEMIKEFSKKLLDIEDKDELKKLVDEISEMADEIFEGTSRIRNIISNFKSFLSREVKREEFDIKNAIDNALKLTYSKWEGRIDIDVSFEGEVPLVYGNRAQMEQVIINLLTNAFYSVIKKGKKRVWIKVEKNNDDFVLLRIIDEGVGIKEKDLPKLFEPLFTTKPLKDEGMGLGLSIVKEIVESHGGKIEVNSKEGEGAEFRVFIPVYKGKKGGEI